MAIIGYDSIRFSGLVKREYDPAQAYCRDVVTGTFTAVPVVNPMPVGTVFGKVTTTGKYRIVEATATDGSQVAAGVYLADSTGASHPVTIVAGVDQQILLMTRGPVILDIAQLSYGASVNTPTLIAAAVAQLKAIGIICETEN